ncbi:MAG: hypothetical protein ACREJ2_12565 [Planctomycetota bacterium]
MRNALSRGIASGLTALRERLANLFAGEVRADRARAVLAALSALPIDALPGDLRADLLALALKLRP